MLIYKSMFKRLKYFFWALFRSHKKLVIDTCILLSGEDRRRLRYLRHVYIPRAVLEQVLRMGLEKEKEKPEYPGAVNIFFVITILVLEKLIQKKWYLAGSSKSGLLQSIENKTLAEFDANTAQQLQAIFRRRKREWNQKREKINLAPIVDPHTVALRDLIGKTDLRIIAACLSLKEKETDKSYLVTRDRSLTVLAQAMGIIVIKQVKDI